MLCNLMFLRWNWIIPSGSFSAALHCVGVWNGVSEVYFPHSYCYGEGEEEWPVLVMHLRITEMVVSYSLKDEELKNLDLSFLTEI